MNAALWGRVDDYIADRLVDEDGTLAAALRANADNGLRPIDVSAAQGKFLHLLVRMSGARRILEIGTLGGYSTIWMAKALPADGSIVTLEYEPRHAEVARRNIERAGYADRIEVRVGAAADTLPLLAAERLQPFDFVFIDADKQSNVDYVAEAIRLGRSGTTIIVDNVVREGGVLDAASDDARIQGTRALFDFLQSDPRIDATALQTVGAKGWDGFVLARVA